MTFRGFASGGLGVPYGSRFCRFGCWVRTPKAADMSISLSLSVTGEKIGTTEKQQRSEGRRGFTGHQYHSGTVPERLLMTSAVSSPA